MQPIHACVERLIITLTIERYIEQQCCDGSHSVRLANVYVEYRLILMLAILSITSFQS